MKLFKNLLNCCPCVKLCFLFLVLKRIFRETVFVKACFGLWALYWCLRRLFCVQRATITVKHKWSYSLCLRFWLLLVCTLDVCTSRCRFDFGYFAFNNRFLHVLAIQALDVSVLKTSIVFHGRLMSVNFLRLLFCNNFKDRALLILHSDWFRCFRLFNEFRHLSLKTFLQYVLEELDADFSLISFRRVQCVPSM